MTKNSTGYLKALLKNNLFQNATDDELANISACLNLEIVTFPKNAFIVLESDILTKIGIVLEGSVAITKITYEGDRIILAVLEEGKVFGAFTAFSQRGSWPCSVEAHRACTVALIPQDKLYSLCEKSCSSHNQLLQSTLRAISEEALILLDKIEILSLKSPREKILTFLREEYETKKRTILKLPLNREELADYLNISRPSLSRELGRLRDEGIITFHKSIIKLEKPDRILEK